MPLNIGVYELRHLHQRVTCFQLFQVGFIPKVGFLQSPWSMSVFSTLNHHGYHQISFPSSK